MRMYFILFAVFQIFSISLQAQEDCLNKVADQAVQISKLKEANKITQDSAELIIKNLQDSKRDLNLYIEKLKKDSVELSDCNQQLKSIKQLQKDIEKLKKDTIGLSLYNLKVNQLADTRKLLDSSNKDIQNLKTANKKLKDSNSVLQRNINECIIEIVKKYDGNFDTVLKSTTVQSTNIDLKLLQNLNSDAVKNPEIDEILQYKRAELLLGDKYDSIKISQAIKFLKFDTINESVKELISLLEGYESNTINLKNTVKDIQVKNELKAGKIEDLISDKKNTTLRIIEDYIYYNEVDLTKYIYLNQILTELKTRKMKNVDADVMDLLEKL